MQTPQVRNCREVKRNMIIAHYSVIFLKILAIIRLDL